MRCSAFSATAVILVLTLALAGCFRMGYSSLVQDSARPPGSTPACGKSLKLKESCLALVRASEWYSPTGLSVSPGESYRISVPAGQVWFDKDRRNLPPYGEKGSWLMNLFSKRDHDSGWFALMAAIVPENQPLSTGTEPVNPGHDVERDQDIAVKFAGRLVMYPNDAVWRTGNKDAFYKNNVGQIWVRIECTQSCAAAP